MTIISYKPVVAFFLLAYMWSSSRAAPGDTVYVASNTAKIDLIDFMRIAAFHYDVSPQEAYSHILAHGVKLPEATVGYTDHVYWALITVANTSPFRIEKVISVENPHIDVIESYFVEGNSLRPWVTTGDRFSFSKRPVLNRNFILPLTLPAGQTQILLLKIDKRNSSLNFPIFLYDNHALHQKDYTENLGYGLYFGIILLFAIYSLFTFFFLRTGVHLWYCLWVITSGLFVFTALGFSNQFLYPLQPDFNSTFRVYIYVFNQVAILKFTQYFLRLRELAPRVHRVLNSFVGILVFMALSYPFAQHLYNRHINAILQFINGLTLTSIALIVYVTIKTFRAQRTSILFFYAAFSALLAGGICIIAIEFGIASPEWFPVNPFMAGSAIEMFIFSVALTYQVKKIYDERNDLSYRFAQQQKEMLKAYVEGVERERERISRELHDDIGSRLSTLNRFVMQEHRHPELLQQQIQILCDDVRSMSHQLAPPSLRIAGLSQKILELADQLEHHHKIKVDVQFYDFPDNLPEDIIVHVYRIAQEALNNITKHAEATLVDLQFFGHDDELVITIEDNGKGFSTTQNPGIGVQNMKTRAESIQGTLEISSQPGRGTQLMLRIPFNKPAMTARQASTEKIS